MDIGDDTDSQGLRADAARNRARLLDAAREAFTEQGLEVSMRQIARRAHVSEPTLRRRFASKEGLVAEAFQDKIASYAEEAEGALRRPDAGAAFAGLLRRLAQMQLGDRGFTEVLSMTFPSTMRAEQHRRRAYTAVTELIHRAKQEGTLRDDFSPEDVVLVLMAHAGIVAGGGAVADALSARFLAYLLESFAAPASGALPPAPTAGATYRALLHASHNAD